ncbi:MAG: undecaprenyl-diphosphate phosphatase [Sulfuritalea sp.]|nr:undecaprenyl-diphosphate phosphatase [Sulfuritalea sp.]
MDSIQIAILSIVQGLTEFLPISSAAHLILFPRLAGWEDQGLTFDIATHLGSLFAVVAYFRRELAGMSRDWARSVRQRRRVGDSTLAWAVLLGTLPVGLAGLLFKGVVETELRAPLVIAVTTVLFAFLLWYADAAGRKNRAARDEHTLTARDICLIGCAQAIALIPGVSRSGITLTAGLLLGLSRSGAARFSFLLSIPVIVLACGLSVFDVVRQAQPVEWGALALAVLLSAVSAYLCIHYFLKLLERFGLFPYVLYRFVLGAVLFYLFAGA